MSYGILLLLLLPIVLLGIWAAFALGARREKGGPEGFGRQDRDEPPELTGEAQHRRREQP